MNAMRVEKVFKGAIELTNEVTLPEAGAMRLAGLGKDLLGIDETRAGFEKRRIKLDVRLPRN